MYEPKHIKVLTEFYEFKCVHCNSRNVYAVTNDGGSVQQCNRCDKSYKAKKVTIAPQNPTPQISPYFYSEHVGNITKSDVPRITQGTVYAQHITGRGVSSGRYT